MGRLHEQIFKCYLGQLKYPEHEKYKKKLDKLTSKLKEGEYEKIQNLYRKYLEGYELCDNCSNLFYEYSSKIDKSKFFSDEIKYCRHLYSRLVNRCLGAIGNESDYKFVDAMNMINEVDQRLKKVLQYMKNVERCEKFTGGLGKEKWTEDKISEVLSQMKPSVSCVPLAKTNNSATTESKTATTERVASSKDKIMTAGKVMTEGKKMTGSNKIAESSEGKIMTGSDDGSYMG